MFDGGLHHTLKKIGCFFDDVVLSQAAGGEGIFVDAVIVFVELC